MRNVEENADRNNSKKLLLYPFMIVFAFLGSAIINFMFDVAGLKMFAANMVVDVVIATIFIMYIGCVYRKNFKIQRQNTYFWLLFALCLISTGISGEVGIVYIPFMAVTVAAVFYGMQFSAVVFMGLAAQYMLLTFPVKNDVYALFAVLVTVAFSAVLASSIKETGAVIYYFMISVICFIVMQLTAYKFELDTMIISDITFKWKLISFLILTIVTNICVICREWRKKTDDNFTGK